jgi:enoyl-CoA hydratase/carnithine racemase
MPEISIGLYPDVGGTWFLNHAPGRTGLFLGLTGAHINAADALFVGLADRFIQHSRKAEVFAALLETCWFGDAQADNRLVNRILRAHESPEELPVSSVRQHYDLIQSLTDGDDVADVAARIQNHPTDDKWLMRAQDTLRKGCPTTAHLVYEQFRRGRKLSLAEVFQMELVMSLQCARHPDFAEGVRALLIERDGKPQWKHESIASVPPSWVEAHFTPPWNAQRINPLSDLHG